MEWGRPGVSWCRWSSGPLGPPPPFLLSGEVRSHARAQSAAARPDPWPGESGGTPAMRTSPRGS
jgi:hypothetical protein